MLTKTVTVFVALLFSGFFLASSVLAVAPQALEYMPVCPPGPKKSTLDCHAVVVAHRGKPQPAPTQSITYNPDQLRSAYGLSTASAPAGTIIGIVDAYDNPNAFSDLNSFNNYWHINTLADYSSGQTPYFRKVDQNGGTNYPAVNSGWALESSLDVQVAHSICRNCNILLVEANSNSYSDLMAAVDRARLMGAKVISNSYGSREFLGENALDSYFNWPGVVFTFSAGDGGYGTSYPASSPYVTAVGGTSLYLNSDNTYKSESVWKGTGSGCSSYEAKPVWQTDTGCAGRTMNDVAAVADPYTGVLVYDTTPYGGSSGPWYQVGGTSLSAPLIAAVYALAGNFNNNSYLYGHSSYLHDITSGSDGHCSKSTSYLCKAVSGYDGPTGLGTPAGSAAF